MTAATTVGRDARQGAADGGAAALEFVILAPVLLMLILVAIAAMRVEVAAEAVDAAAHDAARAASISRSAGQARTDALAAARTTLAGDGLACTDLTISIDATEFANPVGAPGAVRASVTCVVRLSDVAVPGMPGTRTLRSSFTSVIDRYGGA